MLIRSIILLWICCLLLVPVSGCGSGEETEEQESASFGNVIPNPDQGQTIEERTSSGKRERIGLESDRQEVYFETYANSWISLYVDETLDIEEVERGVQFVDAENDVAFRVQWEEEQAAVLAEDIQKQLEDEGYRLHNEFALDEQDGRGYIFHLYDYFEEKRHTIDVYLLENEGRVLVVECHMPDIVLEKYEPRFEYMLNSIRWQIS